MSKVTYHVLSVEEVEDYKKAGYELQKVPCWRLTRLGFRNYYLLEKTIRVA